MAVMAWEARNRGRDVYCNCPEVPEQYIDQLNVPVCDGHACILNFPHRHTDLDSIRDLELYDCYLMSDESVEFMDARRAAAKSVREIGLFGYQATKRGVDWHYDAVRHKNIDPRIRLNPHYIVETWRIPRNPTKPLAGIKWRVTYRYGGTRTGYIIQPWRLFPIYNDVVLVRRQKEDN